ncbi:hypothetical protein JXJ21_22440 [candidate division KSB1 bacterium]|nr:hypothetical protein [candidate division KSB1 bacterium]
MKILRIDRRYRHFRRYRQIVGVLVKYGFDDIADRTGLLRYFQSGKRLFTRGKDKHIHLSTAERIRLGLEELGPTFVKLGQVLSTRSFLIPADLVAELSRLQDDVKPLQFTELNENLQKNGDRSLKDCFEWIDETPLASASIAQVHRARTFDGQEVVVKIRRPQIARLIQTDMEILADIAALVEKYVPELQQFNPTGMADELSRSTKKELDFLNEARNIELFAKNFKNSTYIYVPRLYWELTTQNMVTLEFIQGIKISEIKQLKAAGYDYKAIAHNGAQAILKQVFEDGFFHADPHPGNLFVTEGNIIVPIDFGIMGRLDAEMIDEFSDLFIAAINKDVDLIMRVLVNLGVVGDAIDPRPLKLELSELIARYHGVSVKKINMKIIMDEVIDLSFRYKLRMPSNVMLLLKTLGTYEDLVFMLDPDFDFISATKPYVNNLIKQRLNPKKIGYEAIKTLRDLADLIRVFPREIELLIRKLKKGEISIELQHRRLENLIIELERSSNRIAFSLIIAAIIVGSSLIMVLEKGPILFGYPLFGILGYLFAGMLGVWLVVSILRSGKL